MNDDLSDRLRRAARAAHSDLTRPDLADVEARSRHIHSRRRAVAGLAAAVLVAGAGGVGFGVGQRLGDDGDRLTAAGAQPGPVSTAAPDADTTDTATDTATDQATGQATEGTTAAAPVPSDATASTVVAERDVVAADEAGASSWGAPEYTLVVDRTTDAGVRVRALRSEPWEQGEIVPDAGGWRPAPWCNPTAELRVAVAAPDVVDVGGAGWYSEPQGDAVVSQVPVGWVDGSFVLVVVVQTAPGVTSASATLDGVTDRADVVDGAAVLALPAGSQLSGPVGSDRLTVEITTTDGASRSLAPEELTPYNSRAWRDACTPPPPALPPAGEQPADPAAAEAEIRDRFDLLWDRSIPREEKPTDLLDDRTGVDEARDRLDEGQYAEVADTAVHTIEEFVFTSPTEAWFRYSIDTSSGFFGDRYGTVRLIDGSWRFARAVVCQDLALASAPCEPDVQQVLPPSAQAEMDRIAAEECYGTSDAVECAPPATIAD